MRVSREYGSYNARRYSRPWIGLVTEWPIGSSRPTLVWGAYIGNDAGGEVEIEAEPGDVVRYGQRDNRNINHTEDDFGIVQDDGSIVRTTPAVARKHFLARQAAVAAATSATSATSAT